MAIDDSTPITARAHKAIDEAATAGDGSHVRVAITSLLGAVHSMEVRQTVLHNTLQQQHDIMSHTLASLKKLVEVDQGGQETARAHQEALKEHQDAIAKLRDGIEALAAKVDDLPAQD